jgi:hypothetical protein
VQRRPQSVRGRQRERGEVDQFLRRGSIRLDEAGEEKGSKLTYINVTSGEVATSSAARKPSMH